MTADAVVLAGGMGTRLVEITGGVLPKVMVPVLGRPFVDYKLRSLARLGVGRVVMLLGQGADQVVEHVGDGRSFGLTVTYVFDGPRLLGTGGAVRAALHALPDVFWVTYGDTLVTADLDAAEKRLSDPAILGAMTVLHNRGWLEPSNVELADGLVRTYAKGNPDGLLEWIDYGLLLFRRSAFGALVDGAHVDLSDVVGQLIVGRSLAGVEVSDRFWEVGTPETLRATEEHFRTVRMWEQLQ